jgi:hypothetical protein
MGKDCILTNVFGGKNNAISECLLINDKRYTISDLEKEIKGLEKEVKSERDMIRDKEKNLISKKNILRENSIKRQFNKFIAQKTGIVKKAIYLNKGLLHLAVGSYYDDIHRYKDYCGSEWANNHKQTAYTIKWITKIKPIQIKEEFDSEESLNDEILDINLIFALICGFSFLDRKIIDLIFTEKKEVDKYNLENSVNGKEKRISFYDKLLYNLRFRSFTGKQLVLIFEALELKVNH